MPPQHQALILCGLEILILHEMVGNNRGLISSRGTSRSLRCHLDLPYFSRSLSRALEEAVMKVLSDGHSAGVAAGTYGQPRL